MRAKLVVAAVLICPGARPDVGLHPCFTLSQERADEALAAGRQLAKEGKSPRDCMRPWRQKIRDKGAWVTWVSPDAWFVWLGYQAEKCYWGEQELAEAIAAGPYKPGEPALSTLFVVELRSEIPQRRRAPHKKLAQRVTPLGFVLSDDRGRNWQPAEEPVVLDSPSDEWITDAGGILHTWGSERRRWGTVVATGRIHRAATYLVSFSTVEEDGTPRLPPGADALVLRVILQNAERSARYELSLPTE